MAAAAAAAGGGSRNGMMKNVLSANIISNSFIQSCLDP